MSAILMLYAIFLIGANCDIISNEIKSKKVKIYWNIPTFQCDSHKLNFTSLANKFKIIQNSNDRFRGQEIAILYDPGSFPAILKNDKMARTVIRNGGVPQAGNLTLHLEMFEEILNELIPNENFSGLGVIDFESWRPIFRQNFGVLAPYKELSVELERKSHPFLPSFIIEKEAARKFEFHAKKFMIETLFTAKKLRSNATWGYYAYPYCFNMSPNNMRQTCPKEVTKENDRTDWLFQLSDNYYPSLYLPRMRLNSKEKLEMIQGRIDESHRIVGYNHRNPTNHKIVPYFWFKYHDDTKRFVSKEDLFNAFLYLSGADIDGLIIWGSSNDVNTKIKCLDLFDYIENVLGPALVNNF